MKDPLYHARQLAAYGIYGAGGDETPEQQDFGADCLEAATYLFRIMSSIFSMTKEPKLHVCDKFMTEAELLEKVKEMRQKAQELRK